MNLNSMPTQRQVRFAEVIRSIISTAFIKGDYISTNIDFTTITVSHVRMSKDLKIASVYVMPLGGKNKTETLNSLNECKFYFQKTLSSAKLKSKFTPKINFYIDDSYDEAERIKNLLKSKKVLKDLESE